MMRYIVTTLGVFVLSTSVSVAQDQSDWPSNIVIGTASPGGTHAIYGQGLASIISNHLDMPASTQQTQGPNQNLVLTQMNRIDIGLTTMGPAYEAWTGELELNPGVEHQDVRALIPMYITPFQVASLERSGIASVEDLDGKIVGTGPRGGTGGTYWQRWFDALGLNVTIRNGPLGDQTSQLADGRLDAVATAAGLPISAFSELEATVPANVFSLSNEQIEELLPDLPYARQFTIPAQTYDSLDEPVESLGMWNFVIVNKDMPDDLAYEIVKAVFDHHDELLATHSSAAETLVDNVVENDFLWLHPGAVRYYEEQGIELPEGALPQDI
ncbi:TAXI family TRAP transporter solute-binding subunit [Billgrantia endophytica]|uniref:C4-dicarboxylate ABC transporter substrate-binding protein n=1 Tax=Billgrantia endophytica TaxID=2033802 RepID=A0A2N7U0R6_9GAMM|nr:TAXI family TRAP transporter solute-binding subunit [Halomonas endophytica]PMR74028.1 C4-dicarboxylate ABC transporter substrate-binding protein [Halomonas endophytica]